MSYSRILQKPKTTFFLFGPRGSGKSTWLKTTFKEARFVDLLSEDTFHRLLVDPGSLSRELAGLPRGSWVVLDEVQRLPNLLNEVHRLIEDKGIHFVLCGSSARKLKRAGVNLLGGRAVRKFMHPFVPEELGKDFSLEEALKVGLLPLVLSAEDRRETLEAFSQMYLREEIQVEALVRNLQGFARFLPIAALFHGQAINESNISRDAGVARTTVAGYLDILEETMLAYRLPAYEAKLRVKERKHPKFYWTDSGIVRAIKKSFGDPTPEERGVLFEGLIAHILRSYRDYRRIFDEMYYWAPAESADTEVDFLIKRGPDLIAIEVKSGARFSETWCKGLRAIHGLKNLRRKILVTPSGPEMRTKDGIDILPFNLFMKEIATGNIWE